MTSRTRIQMFYGAAIARGTHQTCKGRRYFTYQYAFDALDQRGNE
ncbi:hypothetical protein [Paraburkholderia oxyphila]|nr:hypothetical protein [Paraburkholderia oxyphila]